MSKGLINKMMLKSILEGADYNQILTALIDEGIISENDIVEYYNNNLKSQDESKLNEVQNNQYSKIVDGVLVEFDERDLNRNGAYIVPRRVHVIDTHAFYRCDNLRKVHLGRDVVEIGMKAFFECKNLQSVTMTNSVRKMGEYAFTFCGNLTTVKLSDNLKEIPEYAFMDCDNLQAISLPTKLERIEKYAFGTCGNLMSISTPPANLTYVHNTAFEGTPIKKDFMRRFQENREFAEQNKGNVK